MSRSLSPVLIFLTIVLSLSSVHAETYYVSTEGSDGNDGLSNNTGGAFRTIQKCADAVSPGDTCIVQAGTYNENIVISVSGNATHPITYQGDGTVIIQKSGAGNVGIIKISGDYVIFDNFEVDGQDSSDSRCVRFFDNANSTFKNGYVHNCRQGIGNYKGYGNNISYNDIKHIGDIAGDLTESGVATYQTQNLYVGYNYLEDIAFGGIYLFYSTSNSIIEFNTVTDSRGEGGIGLDGAEGSYADCRVGGISTGAYLAWCSCHNNTIYNNSVWYSANGLASYDNWAWNNWTHNFVYYPKKGRNNNIKGMVFGATKHALVDGLYIKINNIDAGVDTIKGLTITGGRTDGTTNTTFRNIILEIEDLGTVSAQSSGIYMRAWNEYETRNNLYENIEIRGSGIDGLDYGIYNYHNLGDNFSNVTVQTGYTNLARFGGYDVVNEFGLYDYPLKVNFTLPTAQGSKFNISINSWNGTFKEWQATSDIEIFSMIYSIGGFEPNVDVSIITNNGWSWNGTTDTNGQLEFEYDGGGLQTIFTAQAKSIGSVVPNLSIISPTNGVYIDNFWINGTTNYNANIIYSLNDAENKSLCLNCTSFNVLVNPEPGYYNLKVYALNISDEKVVNTWGADLTVYSSASIPFSDFFDDSLLDPRWSILNDYNNYIESNGFLNITIQPNTGLYQEVRNNAPVLYQTTKDDEYNLTTKVNGRPDEKYEKAGLLIFSDFDNYIYLFNEFRAGQEVILASEENGGKTIIANKSIAADTLWLKLTKSKSNYSAHYSLDGLNYTYLGSIEGKFYEEKIGITAHSGSSATMTFSFDSFGYLKMVYVYGDRNLDGILDDIEILQLIEEWKTGQVSDQEILVAIENWKIDYA